MSAPNSGAQFKTDRPLADKPSGSGYIRYWTQEEDQALVNAVQRHGTSNWASVEDELAMYGRSKSQCSLRWAYNLDPKVNRGPFSAEEDRMLLEAQHTLGNKWKQISEH